MNEPDPLNSLLKEWQAPDPSPAGEARVRAAYRAVQRPSLWQRLWSARITIPVPVLAALLLVVVAAWWLLPVARSVTVRPASTATPTSGGYVTRVEAAGFQPLPDGAVRVIRSGEVRQ
jgi:membrane-associated protease RseP (regulator of RpoE activity)